MFAVHAITRANFVQYRDYIEHYHRLRHQIYVEERGWSDLRRADGREIDAFDTPHATHLLGITADDEVVAGSRLIPSTQPHLLSEVFSSLAENGVPRQPNIFEWTRIFVINRLREKHRASRAAGLMYCAIVEHCLANEITQLTVVCEDYWFARLDGIGWRPRRLGPGLDRDGNRIVALINDMSLEALARTRTFFNIRQPVLFQARTAMHDAL